MGQIFCCRLHVANDTLDLDEFVDARGPMFPYPPPPLRSLLLRVPCVWLRFLETSQSHMLVLAVDGRANVASTRELLTLLLCDRLDIFRTSRLMYIEAGHNVIDWCCSA